MYVCAVDYRRVYRADFYDDHEHPHIYAHCRWGWNTVWFKAIRLLNLKIVATSSPFSVVQFVIKGVAPTGTLTGIISCGKRIVAFWDLFSLVT